MKEWIEWMDSVRAAIKPMLLETTPIDYLEMFPTIPAKERKVSDILIEQSYKKGKNITSSLSEFVEWLIEIFDYRHIGNLEEYIKGECKKNPVYGELAARWIRDSRKELDWFGTVYEETFQGKGKADTLGQFYTPPSLSRLVGEITGMTDEDMVFGDCCCGSGRLLLSAKAHPDRFNYYVGEDVDIESVRMCALNLMVNGKRGMVVCHDSLTWDRFITAYEVNESNSPFVCGLLSIREMTQEEAEKKLSGDDNALLLKERMVYRAIKEHQGKISIDEPFKVYANEYAARNVLSNPPFGMKMSDEEQKKMVEYHSFCFAKKGLVNQSCEAD